MMKLIFAFASCLIAASALAQEAPQDKDAQARVRAEGSAGGLGQQLTKEQREAVKSGARQHRDHREALDTVKRTDEQEQAAARGGTSSDRQKDNGKK